MVCVPDETLNKIMPNVSLTVPEVQQSVARPVIYDIVRQVCAITKLPDNLPIYIPGDTEAVSQQGSTLNDQQANVDPTRLSADNNIQIEVEESFNEGNVLSTAVAQTEQLPLFFDPALAVMIKPAYAAVDVKITFKFSSNSRTLTERWRNDMRMRISMLRDINLHILKYHYPIPQAFYNVLVEIHKRREAVDGYKEDFNTYLQTNCSTNVTRAADLTGKTTGFVVAQTQTRVQGLFDVEIAPEKAQREGNSENWVSTFTYNFTYDKPVMVNMKYPVMVHNQLMPEELLVFKEPPEYSKRNLTWTSSLLAARHFEAESRIEAARAKQVVTTVPSYDEFLPLQRPYGSQPYLTMLCQVDASDPTLMLNLADLGEYALDADVMAFVKAGEYKFMGKPRQSILSVTPFVGNIPVQFDGYLIDDQMNVRTTVPQSMRLIHRVSFALNTNLGQLPTEALKRLRRNPAAGNKLLRAINATHHQLMHVRQRCDLFPIMPHIPLNARAWRDYSNTLVSMRTVQSSFVIAHRNGS